jgi:hypothetical protein
MNDLTQSSRRLTQSLRRKVAEIAEEFSVNSAVSAF